MCHYWPFECPSFPAVLSLDRTIGSRLTERVLLWFPVERAMKKPQPQPTSSMIARWVTNAVNATPVYDIHTHLYDPAFGELLLWGIDDLLVYHYLIAEAFRYFEIPYEKFWALSKTQQADLIWEKLFLEHSPVSEACRGVLTVLNTLGLDVKKRDLRAIRKW